MLDANLNRGVIDPRRLTYESILNDLITYIQSQPDSEKWLDYFKFSEGATLTEMMSGVASFLRYHALMTNRESSHLTARLRSTIYGMADLLGYPVNRRRAPKLRLKLIADKDVYLSRNVPIGRLGGRSLSLVENTQLNLGQNTVDVLLGDWVTQSTTSTSSKPFSEFKWRVDTADEGLQIEDVDEIDNEHFELALDGTLIPWTRYKEELGAGKGAVVSTLAYSVSAIFGGEGVGRQIRSGEVVSIHYLKVDAKPLSNSSYTTANATVDINGVALDSLAVITPFYASDSLEKIVLLLGGYHAAQRRMVSKEDHAVMVASYPGMKDAKWYRGFCTINGKRDNSLTMDLDCRDAGGAWTKSSTQCCTQTVAYLFQDEHEATLREKEEIYAYLDPFLMGGAEVELFKAKPIYLAVSGTVLVPSGVDVDLVNGKIAAVIDKFTMQLGYRFQLNKLIDDIRAIDEVESLYINQPVRDLQCGDDQYLRRSITSIKVTTDPAQLNFIGADKGDQGFIEN